MTPGATRPSSALLSTVTMALGAGLLALYAARYPLTAPALPSLSPLDPGKLLAQGRVLLAWLVLNLAALGAAWPLERLWRHGDRAMQAVLRVTLGLFGLGAGVLLLGLAGALAPRLVVGLVGLAACAGAFVALREGSRLQSAGLWRSPLAWCTGLGLSLPLLIGLTPEWGWDALTYHLALPERFLRTGRIAVDPFSIFTTFPLLTEMVYAAALPIGGAALAKLVNLELGALLLAALFATGRRAGRVAPVFAVLCVLADPLFLWESTVVYADLALALATVLTIAATLDWDDDPHRATAVRAAVLSGLCAGIRYPGALVAVALALALVVAGRQPWPRRVAMGAVLGVGSLAGLAPWLARNLAATGTPLALNVFDDVYLRQLYRFNHDVVGMGRHPLDFVALLWHATLSSVPGVYTSSFGFQIGPVYLLAALVAVLALRRRSQGFLLVAAVVLLLAWFLTIQEARYLLPALVTLALAGAFAAERLEFATSRARAAGGALLVTAAVMAQVWLWNHSGAVFRIAFGDVGWRELDRATPAEVIGAQLRTEARAGVRVLTLFEPRTWHLRGVDSIPYHFYEASPTLVAVHQALGAGRLCAWIHEQRVTHVVVNVPAAKQRPPTFVAGYSAADYDRDLAQLSQFLAASARVVNDVGGTVLLELLPRDACREPQP